MIELFSEEENNGSLSKMIVVGIPSRDRIHDLTPSNDLNPSGSSAVPLNDSDFITSGGAEKLTLFIRDELIPYIDSTYNTSGFKILAGHSFGGLMASNALLFYPDLFNGYIAADPSIWWNHQEIMKQADTIVKKTDFKDTYFFYANSSSASKFAKTIKDPAVRNPYHSELNFGSAFADNRQNIPGFTWIHYERENHGSIPLIALYDGLRIMSEVYRKSNLYKSITATSSLISDSGNQGNESIQKEQKPVYVNEVKNKLKELSTVKTKISDDNSSLMVYNDSIHTSANLYKIMGEIYEFKGDKERALMNYKKSLLVDPGNKTMKSRIKRL